MSEAEFNDRMAKAVNAAVESLKREFDTKFADTTKKLTELAASMPSGEALTKTITDAVDVAVRQEARDIRADVLTLRDSIETTKRNHAFGLGKTQPSGTRLTVEDYKAALPAKIKTTPLEQIAQFVEGR